MFRSSKFFVVLFVLVFATASFAFAATNTVPTTQAGDGAETISGYTVNNVNYNLDATTPSNIASVDLTLSPSALTTSTVKISLVTGGSFYTCSSTDGADWNCPTAGATVSAANSLRVIAAR
jgi:hypothetical protein